MNIRHIFNKYSTAFWISLPIIISFIVNTGIIFNISNQFEFLESTTHYLSQLRENGISINLLIGIGAAFVLFFTFVSISYSIRSIPKSILRKYIFKNRITYNYFGVQSSLALNTAFFVYTEQIRNSTLMFMLQPSI